MRALKEQGVTMMFISHHLEEVYEVCQSVSVFRDARHILTASVDDLPHGELVDAMTGEATAAYEYRSRTVDDSAPVVIAAKGLGLGGRYEDVDLTVRAGEIVGLAGSGSSGKVGLAETLVGLRKADTGTVTVNGTVVKPGTCRPCSPRASASSPRTGTTRGSSRCCRSRRTRPSRSRASSAGSARSPRPAAVSAAPR
ncbi:ATP-binding cassette domain-containing protein [Streptosporangium lutulentum]